MALSNLQTRILSAVLLIPLAVFVLWYGSWLAVIALSIIAAIAAWEWGNIIHKTPTYTLSKTILIVSSAAISLLWGGSFLIPSYENLFIKTIFAILTLSLIFFLFYKNSHKSDYITGLFVVVLTSMSLIFIRFFDGNNKEGFWLLFYLFLLTWAMDSGAYFCGRFLKGPKLAPKISPNKTWSGFIGGLFCVLLLSITVSIILKNTILKASYDDFAIFIVVSLLVAALGHGGDLAESAFKRKFNVKDSSQIIPGHGGVLDRLDSLAVSSWVVALMLFALIATYL